MKALTIFKLAPFFAGLLSAGCQTADPGQKLSLAEPTPAEPLPKWTGQPSQARSQTQVQIRTKIIEVVRPAESTEVPGGRYERKMGENEFEEFIKEKSQQKGIDLLTAPSVVTRDGQNATIEIIREFVYPLAPGDSPEFETENVGITSHFQANHIGGKKVTLKAFTRVSEFEGFNKAESDFDLPVFNRRDIETDTTLKSGETIVVGGLIDEITQDVEDSALLGLVKKRSTEKLKRELIVTITANIVAPDGVPLAAR